LLPSGLKIVDIKKNDMSEIAVNIKELNEKIQKESAFVDMVTIEMKKVIIGQKLMVIFCWRVSPDWLKHWR
jgi:capsid portal protein